MGLRAQVEAPRVNFLCRINHGLGGILEFSDGTTREFHLEVAWVRACLRDRRNPDEAARLIAVGSADEKAILAGLEAWAAATFTADEQRELLALPRLPDPHSQEEDHAHQRAELLRTLRRYSQVTHPAVSKVFAGRGTVSLSLQLQLGDGAAQQVLWRRFGDDAFARIHLDTDLEPVPLDSGTERRLLLGLAHWLADRLGGVERLFAGAPEHLDRDVQLVLGAFRGYLAATSPRLRSAGTVMDAGNTGSSVFYWSDAQNRMFSARVDYAAGTETPGRLRDGEGRDAPVVELGSARETELLDTLQRAATLRRRWSRDKGAADSVLRRLEEELEKYRTRFPRGK